MPNNFKLTGGTYVSKAGSDSNSGTTPDAPKRTLQAGMATTFANTTRTVVIGAGVYNENISISQVGNNSVFIADGKVIIDGSGGKRFFVAAYQDGFYTYYSNLEFRNFRDVGGTLYSPSFNPLSTIYYGTSYHALNNCIFNNCSIYYDHYYSMQYTNCKFVNCLFTNNTAYPSGNTFNNCTFINCLISHPITAFISSYTNTNTVITANSSVTAANFNYNNIQGSVIMKAASTVTSGIIQDTYGRYYDLSTASFSGDGTVGLPYGRPYTNGAAFYFANHRTAYPTMNTSSSAFDPKFNNIQKRDFSLQPNSPMIGRASNGIDNLGGNQIGINVPASGSLFSGSSATVESLVFNSSDYIISGSALSGSVTSAPIFISSSAKVIQEIDYNGLLAFNKDTTAFSGSNVQVPDAVTYTSASLQAGANPDRLTYYMRWTTGSSQPVSDAQWDNGGLWPSGSFNLFEWNTKPAIDYAGRGNGYQDYTFANTPNYIRATYIQLKVTLRNDYLI